LHALLHTIYTHLLGILMEIAEVRNGHMPLQNLPVHLLFWRMPHITSPVAQVEACLLPTPASSLTCLAGGSLGGASPCLPLGCLLGGYALCDATLYSPASPFLLVPLPGILMTISILKYS